MAENKKTVWTTIRYWLTLNAGILLLSCGVYFFKAPNGFATGGVSGISILLYNLFPVLSQATYMAILNVLLLVVGVLVLGRDCGFMTILCSLLFSAETWVMERLIPLSGPLTDQPLLELVYAILLTGIGSAIIFNCEASSGGTDIVALILKKYTSLNVGRALLVSDFLITAATFFIFDVRTGLYALLGLFCKAFIVDSAIESFNLCKFFTIVTENPAPIEAYIMGSLHRGVTEEQAVGGFTGQSRTVLMTVCRRIDAVALRKKIRELDPGAFVVITNTSEIIGRGFRSV